MLLCGTRKLTYCVIVDDSSLSTRTESLLLLYFVSSPQLCISTQKTVRLSSSTIYKQNIRKVWASQLFCFSFKWSLVGLSGQSTALLMTKLIIIKLITWTTYSYYLLILYWLNTLTVTHISHIAYITNFSNPFWFSSMSKSRWNSIKRICVVSVQFDCGISFHLLHRCSLLVADNIIMMSKCHGLDGGDGASAVHTTTIQYAFNLLWPNLRTETDEIDIYGSRLLQKQWRCSKNYFLNATFVFPNS